MPSLSLVVSVYNKPERLRLVLEACKRQSFRDFEVVIGDDGSDEQVADLIAELQRECRFPLIHLWHEDRGWRKNTMLNKAIRAARGTHLVFIDGDCIPSTHFLTDHWNERRERKVILGRRAEMSQRWSEELTPEKIRDGSFERLGWKELL
ncbi:MAG: glycosyltransferase, partial [Ignavibacteria bacterium]|nr:glycosyltransferase [Ignavibacteria bacterium]